MSTRIERVRYYDGEYLRANDFETEQAYHREMRRRLNLQLHLFGIVEGLQLLQDPDSQPPDAIQFYLSEGLAIDQLGREIIVVAPAPLRGNLLKKKNLQAGDNEIWLCYRESPSGLPSAGYGQCNDPSQNTRWNETYDLVFVPIPKPVLPPGSFQEDPDAVRKGVRLGTITLANTPGGLQVSDVEMEWRTYIGLRAARVVHPAPSVSALDPLKENRKPADEPPAGTLDVAPIMMARQDLLVERNIFAGADFEVKAADAVEPLPNPFPQDGNVKIANHLILRGEMFTSRNGKWYGLQRFIQDSMPEFRIDVLKITTEANTPNPSMDTVTVTKASTRAFSSSADILVSIAGFELLPKNTLVTNPDSWFDDIANSPIIVSVSAITEKKAGTDNEFDFKITWTVGPRTTPAMASDRAIPLTSITISYLIIFYP